MDRKRRPPVLSPPPRRPFLRGQTIVKGKESGHVQFSRNLLEKCLMKRQGVKKCYCEDISHGDTILPSVMKYPQCFHAPSQYHQTSIGLLTSKTVSPGFFRAKKEPVKTKDIPHDRARRIIRRPFSGSHLHVDPDLTGAWSYLVTGLKWWVVLAEGNALPGSRSLIQLFK